MRPPPLDALLNQSKDGSVFRIYSHTHYTVLTQQFPCTIYHIALLSRADLEGRSGPPVFTVIFFISDSYRPICNIHFSANKNVDWLNPDF